MMKRILIVVILLAVPFCFGQTQTSKVRTYYIAADEVDWDYAPGGVNKMMGMKFDGYSKVFVERGPHRIGSIYRKARIANIPTKPLPALNHGRRSGSPPEFSVRFCGLRSATRFA